MNSLFTLENFHLVEPDAHYSVGVEFSDLYSPIKGVTVVVRRREFFSDVQTIVASQFFAGETK